MNEWMDTTFYCKLKLGFISFISELTGKRKALKIVYCVYNIHSLVSRNSLRQGLMANAVGGQLIFVDNVCLHGLSDSWDKWSVWVSVIVGCCNNVAGLHQRTGVVRETNKDFTFQINFSQFKKHSVYSTELVWFRHYSHQQRPCLLSTDQTR